jgi:hypothetical protein
VTLTCSKIGPSRAYNKPIWEVPCKVAYWVRHHTQTTNSNTNKQRGQQQRENKNAYREFAQAARRVFRTVFAIHALPGGE